MSRPFTVALLQLRAFDLAQHREAWSDLLRHIDEAAALDPHPDLIVLPEASYPAYFLHSRASYDAAGVLPDTEVTATLAERALRHGSAIAIGLVQRGLPDSAADGMLENAAVVFAADGTLAGRTTKSFLWHFDSVWFTPGMRYPVFNIGAARAGAIVCADARLPEITRTLAVGGAELIVDCTAWVSSGRDPAALKTAQVDYVIPTRAIENGAWIVAANKVGVEAGTIVYAGRSGVVNPRGEWVAQGPSDRPGIVTHTLDLDEATGLPLERVPRLYADASVAGERSRAAALAREPIVVADAAARVAAASIEALPSAVELMERLRALVRSLAAQGVQLVVLPDLAGVDPQAVSQRDLLPLIETLAAETNTLIAVLIAERTASHMYKTLYLIGSGSILAAHRQSHLTERERIGGYTAGDTAPPVVETALGNIGVLAGAEGLAFELARGLKLRGAELIAWCASDGAGFTSLADVPLRTIARARANEERAYVIAAGGTTNVGGGFVIDATGAVLAETISGRAMAVSADVHRMLARWNEMAPGTNPVRDRQPQAFGILFEPDSGT